MKSLLHPTKTPWQILFLMLCIFSTAFPGFSQTTVPFTSSGTWTCPVGVTSVTVECWGGGGAGGGATGNVSAGGGGGGGSYVKNTAISVTPGTVYTVTVGTGATGGTGAGAVGNNSWFGATTTILAKGGNGGALASTNGSFAAGAVALTTGNVGAGAGLSFYGGGGGAGTSGGAAGGGGGSSAGTASNGNTPVGSAAGAAVTGGGAGVAGSTTGADGADNSNLGGGGAGGRASNGTDRSGGNGGAGKVNVIYTQLTYKSTLVGFSLGATSWCAGETRNVTVQIQNSGTATWSDGTAGTPDINVGVKWNTNGSNWTDYYIRTDGQNLAPGQTGTFILPITASNNIGSGYTTPLAAGSNNLIFDVVYEGFSWFGDNNGGVGPGNTKFTSPAQTIVSPTITLGANPSVCTGATSANLPYTATTGSPNQYSIDFNTAANNAGFADVTLAALPASPIVLTVPAGAAAATYSGTVTVSNSSLSCTGTTSSAFTVTITGNSTLALTSAAATTNQTACINTAITNITYLVGGTGTGAGVSGLPAGVTGTYNSTSKVYTISGSATVSGTFSYTVTSTGPCVNPSLGGTITVTANSTLSLSSSPATAAQILCQNTAITNITYAVGGTATSASATGLPAGVTGSYSAGVFTISGTATAAGNFNYTVTTTGPCADPSLTGTILVNALPAGVGVTPAASTICIGSPVNLTGAGTISSASVNLVNDNFNGTPTFTGGGSTAGGNSQIFTKETSGTNINTVGTITSPNGGSFMAAIGGAQCGFSSCTSSASTTLTSAPINTTGFTGLTLTYSHTYKQANVSGSGTVEVSTNGTTWTILKTFTTNQGAATAFAADNISLASTYLNQATLRIRFNFVSSGSSGILGSHSAWWVIDDVLLNGQAVPTYSWTANTGAGINGLPAAAATSTSANKNITVNPTATTTYTVTVKDPVTNCGISTATATVNVNQNSTISLTSAGTTNAQILCVNNPITAITYAIGGGGTGALLSGTLPAGVTGAFSAGVFTISGTPTVAGTFNYTVTTAGPCVNPALSGSIIVQANSVINLSSVAGSDLQTVCMFSPMTNISYAISGGGTGAGITDGNLPSGVTGSYANGIFTISGTPTESGVFNYTVTTTGPCVNSAASGIITINIPPDAPLGSNQTVCEDGNPMQTLTATATGGTITWYNAATNGNVVTPTQTGVGTSTYYAQANDGTCNSLTRTAVILTINAAPVVTASNQTVCSDGTTTQTLTATATGGTITWYDAATGGNVVSSPTQTGVGSVTYYAEAFDGTCTSLTKTAVVLTINPVPNAPISGGDQTVCSDGNPTQTLTATASGGTITWYNTATNGNVVTPVQSGVGTSTYYAEASDGTCSSLSRTAVVLTINPVPNAPISGGDQIVCSDGSLTQTLTATASGGTITWYDAATNGNVTTPIQTGVGTSTFYAESSDGTCSSLTRTAVILTINPVPNAPVSGGDQTVCSDGTLTQTLTATATGTNVTWYDAATNGNVVTPVQTGVGTATYYAEASNGDCASLTRTAVVLTINPVPNAPLSGGDQTVCSDGTPTQTLTATATGANVTWYDAATNGNVVTTPVQTGVGTITYFAESSDGTCSSLSRTAVTLTINPVPNSPVSGGDQTVCSDGSPTQTLTATASGGTITWYDAATNGNVVAPTQVGPGATTYYAQSSDGTCSSLGRTAVTLTINVLPETATVSVIQPNCATATGTITVTAPTGAGFEYSIGSGFQANPVFTGLAANTYAVSVKNNFGCIALVNANATVNPQPFVPGAPVVSGIVNICPYIGTNEQVIYTAAVAGATSYNWILPPNVTLHSGSGTGTIALTFDSAFALQPNKQLRVTAQSACGTSGLTIYYLLAQFPTTPGVISGPTNICELINTPNTATYSIRKVTAATSYVWSTQVGTTSVTHPAGPGANDTVIVVSYATGYTSSAITVSAVNSCGTSNSVRSLFIPRTVAQTPALISGPTNVCANILPSGTAATYSVTPVVGATSYTWTTPGNAVVTHPNGEGPNDYTITVQFAAGFTNGIVSVSAKNGCGTSGLRTMAVTKLNPATPGVIDVIQTNNCGDALGRIYSYTISAMPVNANNVQWTVPASATILSGQGTTSISVLYPQTAVQGNVTVQSFNDCASSTTRSIVIRLGICSPERTANFAKGNTISEQPVTLGAQKMEVNVFPNPTVADFKLQVITAGKEKINVRILDMQGREFKTISVLPYQTISVGAELKAGAYLVETTQGKEVKTTKVVKF